MKTSDILRNQLEDTYGLKFEFRGVPEERRVHLLASYIYQLPVMCKAARLEPQDISLGGMTVRIENFHARHYGAYLPDEDVITLNSEHPNVFAHEWFHALDYRIGKAMGLNAPLMLSAERCDPRALEITGRLDAFNPLRQRCLKYGGQKAGYLASMTEMTARTFERLVAVSGHCPILVDEQTHKEAENPKMLCSVTYPKKDELEVMDVPCLLAAWQAEKLRKPLTKEEVAVKKLEKLVNEYMKAPEPMKQFILSKFMSGAETMALFENPSKNATERVDTLFRTMARDSRAVLER